MSRLEDHAMYAKTVDMIERMKKGDRKAKGWLIGAKSVKPDSPLSRFIQDALGGSHKQKKKVKQLSETAKKDIEFFQSKGRRKLLRKRPLRRR